MTSSSLDGIPGVGAKKKTLLLRGVAEPSKIPKMSAEELARIPGLGDKTARIIHRHFHPESSEG